MRPNKLQQLIIFGLIVSQVFLMPGLAFAFVSTASGSLNAVPINDSGSIVGNTAFDGVFSPIKTTYVGCSSVMRNFETTDSATQLGFSFSGILGGDSTYAVQLGKEIAAYNVYLTCLGGAITALDAVIAPNTYTSNIKQQLMSQLKADAVTYQAKLTTAHSRYNVASQNIWKALLITVLINTTKAVADQLVTKLVNSYKISNIKAYTDSLATLAYDNQFIRDNFSSNQSQMMARAILTNPIFRTQIQPGIYAQADSALQYNGTTFTPTTLSTSDSNYYAKMAMAGSASANPYYLQTAYVSGVDQSHANAVTTAQSHISQGNGYKAPVNCAGSFAQQNSIDLQTKAASDKLADRKALLANLTQAQAAGTKVSTSDLAKAQSDYDAALSAWNKLPDTVTGINSATQSSSFTTNLTSGTNTEGTAAIVMCEAVSSPAVLINQGIDAVFKSMSDNMSQYNNNNLPGFLSSISGIATQIGSSLILGGITGQSTTVNEKIAVSQAVSTAASAAVQTYNDNAAEKLQKGITEFDATAASNITNGYYLKWSISTSTLPTASYVTITGNSITGITKQALSGTYLVIPTSSSTYLLTVYNASGKALTSDTQDITVSSTVTYNPQTPQVAGAFTSQPVLNIRGPAVTVSPRGD